jgi:pimeloyl-ACP methyl ester carboxylesterase
MAIAMELGEPREIELAAGTIRYRERGVGEPVVFLHGLIYTGDLWRNVVPSVATSYRCLTPDLPFGAHFPAMESTADLTPPGLARLVVDFLDRLDLPAATLVANDTGGAICQLVAANHPDRVARLVLTSCDAFDNFLPLSVRYAQALGWVPGAMMLLPHLLGIDTVRRLPFVLGRLSKRGLDPAVLEAALQPLQRDAGVRRDLAKVLRGISSRYTVAAAKRLRAFDRPTLIAWAEEDHLFPVAHADRLGDILPNARVVRIADSWSFVPEDQPDLLARLIVAFLRDHPIAVAST